MATEEHIEEMISSVYHKKGGCVVRHIKGLILRNPCSHRGQGYNISLEKRYKMYNEPYAYKAQKIKYRKWKEIKVGESLDYEFWRWYNPTVSENRNWDIGHRRNFKRSYTPYLHNYHHLIPNGVLNSELYDKEHGSRLLKLLMAGKYNINNGRNIIILPQEEWIGKIIKLPVHCPGGARCHKAYSNYIRPLLNKIKKQLKKKLKDKTLHEAAKENIEKIAENVYKISDGACEKSQGGLLKLLKSLVPGSDINNRAKLEEAAKKC